MLDTETKGRIDSARDILVGKVPDPKSQVEQITIALIYKFMDDMDRQSEELGGKATFFTGDFRKYRWANLLDKRLGGHERMILYAEGIEKMNVNKNMPQLFRDIFKGVFLPYRDPETLNLFLKEINGFTYDHSERLGDAFEYLLSVLGTQGDAGQFRTPRHIIDFIVSVVDPRKNETVLDPACGTAGFLISAFKHILKGNENLTPDERARLMTNFRGYDIAPDMVRLSRANLYLHGFPNPVIHEYDTLTSEERWDERCDVIMANPPFMSPKGGIRPHNRFSIKAKRSEVLFVDYIAEHLNSGGRAGIIVPEGIIFQGQNAYRQLRKMLVDNYLWAVVSLPAGVFNPYSGVKTSILFLDRNLAKRADEVLFVKVENDGFDLGAQRRPNGKNDLPEALKILNDHIKAQKSQEGKMALTVSRKRLLESGDVNLSGDRYRETIAIQSKWPMVKLGEAAEFISGYAFKSIDMTAAPLDATYRRVVKIGNVGRDGQLDMADAQFHAYSDDLDCFVLRVGDVVMAMTGATVGKVAVVKEDGFLLNQRVGVLRARPTALQSYVLHLLCSAAFYDFCQRTAGGGAQGNIASREILEYQIPLPPLEVQKEIVAEIEGCRKVINGARAVLDNYRPHIPIHPDWPMVALGDSDLFKIESGGTPKSEVAEYWGGLIAWATLVDLPASDFVTEIRSTQRTITERGLAESSAKLVPENSVIVSTRATIGRIGINRVPLATNQGFKNVIIEDVTRAVPEYVAFAMTDLVPIMDAWATGGTFKELSKSKFSELEIPLPPLATQQAIAAEIEAEQALVAANRELITRFEKKIQAALARVWEEKCIDQRKDE